MTPYKPRDLLADWQDEREANALIDGMMALSDVPEPEALSDHGVLVLTYYCVAVVFVILAAPLLYDLARTWGPVVWKWAAR